jgi:galactitol-specific phosphotransferase system IIB component
MSDIRDAIMQLAGTKNVDPVKVYSGEVQSVNEDNRTCDVLVISADAEYTLPNCQLSASNNDGFILIPEIDSDVVVIETVRSGRYLLLTSDVQKVISNQSEFIINEGENGGVPIAQKVTDRLNDIENKLNTFISIFNAHTHTSPPAPVNPVTTTPSTSPMTQTVTVTKSSQLENTKFKH